MIYFNFDANRKSVLPITGLIPSALRDFFLGFRSAYKKYDINNLVEPDSKLSTYERLEIDGSKEAFDEYLGAILSCQDPEQEPGYFFCGGFITCILQVIDSDRTGIVFFDRSYRSVHNQIVGYLTALSICGEKHVYEAEMRQFLGIQLAVENAIVKTEPWFRACEVRYGVGNLYGLLIAIDADGSAAASWRSEPLVEGVGESRSTRQRQRSRTT
jgi:hypothetical protein